MRRSIAFAAVVMIAGAALSAGTTQPDDADVGKVRFVERCGLCHSAEPSDGLGGMGPDLHAVIGAKAAAADPNFPYTQALRDSNLVWDRATLSRFLSGPGKLVPGTAMEAVVDDPVMRDQMIAYFQRLKQPPPAR